MSKVNKSDNQPSGKIDEEMLRQYDNSPELKKLLEASKALLDQAGFPEEFLPKK